MKKAALFFFLFFGFFATDSPATAAGNKPLPGLYKVKNSECPVLDLQSFYCRDGDKFQVRFTPETCQVRPRPDAVWYDGANFYFIWIKDYQTEYPKGEERKTLATSIYWIAQNNCPNLTLKNVCNNDVVRNFKPSTKCYKDANGLYWNGSSYRFGWVRIKQGIGQIISK